jgi:CheY-like chemotaxis protein
MLTDHTMPGGTGLELVESVRASGLRTPIIMMTGLGESLPGPDLERAGVDLLLAKPFTRESLEQAMGSLMGTRV